MFVLGGFDQSGLVGVWFSHTLTRTPHFIFPQHTYKPSSLPLSLQKTSNSLSSSLSLQLPQPPHRTFPSRILPTTVRYSIYSSYGHSSATGIRLLSPTHYHFPPPDSGTHRRLLGTTTFCAQMDSSPSSMKISPLDLMAAIIKGKMDPSNASADLSGAQVTSVMLENREFVMILTTSIAVLIGCVVVLIWRRSSAPPKPRVIQPPAPVIVTPEPEVDDGTKKVTIFFGTQTGTAEGFAKVWFYIRTLQFQSISFLC